MIAEKQTEVTGMSDAMTNREIEDVLTSIRRLVAQESHRPEGGRLILTQAQRILPETVPPAAAPDTAQPATPPMPVPLPAIDDGQAPAVAHLQGGLPEPDFRRLEATIAELEAAVSASGTVWDPDGSEKGAEGRSNVTELYSKLSFVHGAMHARKASAANTAPADALATNGAPVTPAPAPEQPMAIKAASIPPAMPQSAQDGTDPSEDDSDTDMFETVIDETTLRVLVAQIVREELHGQLGERITMQVRKLVRSEIAKALDDRNFV